MKKVNENQKKISIISPAYNASNYINRFLHAIKDQTFQSFQWIIIDDGSTDNTLEIIQRFQSDNPKLGVEVLAKANGGVSSARNLGLKYASGDYLAFADSDDIPEPNWLENIVEEINKYPQENLIVRNAIRVKPSQEVIREIYPIFKPKNYGTFSYLAGCLLEMKMSGYLFSTVFKRHIWKDVWFDEDIQFLEDELVLLRILINNPNSRYVYTSKSDYLYVQNPNSYLHTMTYEKRLNSLKAVNQMEAFLEEKDDLDVYMHELYRRKSSIYFSLAKLAARDKMHEQFKLYLSKYKKYEQMATIPNYFSQRIFDKVKYIVSHTNSEYIFRLLAMRNEKILSRESFKNGEGS